MYIYMEGSEQLSAVPDELFRRIITDCRFVGGWVSRKAGKPSPDVVAKRDVSPPPPPSLENISRSFRTKSMSEACELTLTVHKVKCFFFKYHHMYTAVILYTQVYFRLAAQYIVLILLHVAATNGSHFPSTCITGGHVNLLAPELFFNFSTSCI